MRLGSIDECMHVIGQLKRVLIVGSGPSVWGIDKVNLGKYTVIAVNAGCGMVEPDLMLTMNRNACNVPEIWDALNGKYHLTTDELYASGYPHDCYVMDRHLLRGTEYGFMLDGEGGIVGRAIKLAAHCGADTIHMIGVDMGNDDSHYYNALESDFSKPPSRMCVSVSNIIKRMPAIKFGHYGQSALVNKTVRKLK